MTQREKIIQCADNIIQYNLEDIIFKRVVDDFSTYLGNNLNFKDSQHFYDLVYNQIKLRM